jgi:hypothetical protein
MNVRAQAVGMASQTQNVANAIVQHFYAFYMFAGICGMLAAFVWFFVPETKKISLEETDVLFGGSNHVEKGADLIGAEDAHHARLESIEMDNDVARIFRK